MPKNAGTTCFNVRTAFFGWVSIYFGIEYSSICAIIGSNGAEHRGFLKNAVRRNIVFIAASLKYARLMFPIGDRVDNGRALRSNKNDVSPCA